MSSIAFWNARKKRKKNPMICFELKSPNELVFTLKNLKSNPAFKPYKSVGVRKYLIKTSQLQEIVSICDRKKWEVVPFPDEVQKALDKEKLWPFNEKFKKTGLYRLMFEYQREGLRHAVTHFNGRCLIGDEMGLGKTLQAIAIMKYYRGVDKMERVLIVCPAYLRHNWKQEFNKWMPFLKPVLIEKGNQSLEGWPLIISYDLASVKADELKKLKIEMVICDESHYLKSHKTKRTKALTPVVKAAKRAVFLTGTPALNRPSELYSQAHMLYPKTFPSFRKYAVRYCNAQMSPLGFFDTSGMSNNYELKWLCRKMFMIRRTKDSVLKDLPEKVRSEIYLDVKAKDLKPLKPGMKEWKELNYNITQMEPCSDEIKSASFRRKCLISELFRLTSVAKTAIVCKVVNDLAESGVPFLVFCYHKELMTRLENTLSNYSYFRIDGNTPTAKRQEMVNEFQDGQYQVAILSLLAASTGITLTRASMVVFAEMYWTPGVMLQAEDRVHRIGQKNACDIKYLITRGTLDEYLFKKLNSKLSTLDNILDGRNDRSLGGEQFELR